MRDCVITMVDWVQGIYFSLAARLDFLTGIYTLTLTSRIFTELRNQSTPYPISYATLYSEWNPVHVLISKIKYAK